MNGLPKPCYVMSEPHLSGYRVVLGYETLTEAQDAQTALAASPPAREEAPADPCAPHKAEGFSLDPCCPHCEAPAEGTGETLDALADRLEREATEDMALGGQRSDLADAALEVAAALRNRTSEPEAGEAERTYYGKDCPVGMVQVEFVGCSPSERYSDYGWKPTKAAFIELYVDGERYRIDAGEIGHNCFDGKPRRGIHINYPIGSALGDRSVNALSLSNPGAVPFWSSAPATADKLRVAVEALEKIVGDYDDYRPNESEFDEGFLQGLSRAALSADQALAALNEQPQ